MEFWNNIINTALLGTDKRQVGREELSTELSDAYQQIISNEEIDKEEKFLQITSAALNFRVCGNAPSSENVIVKEADKETRPYCNVASLQVLKDIFEEQSQSLLVFWLQQCNAKDQIVTPELVPALFDIAVNQKKLRSLITGCCGKRGEWLSDLNPDWQFYVRENDDEVWQNGTSELRKKVLARMRETDPAKAREWLKQTWTAENANTKTELLKQLGTNISADDLEWLEILLEEKSQKVRDVVLDLLKRIPGSSIITSYWDILQKSVVVKKEKTLLGMGSKTSIQIQPPEVNDSVFKSGIEKLSNTKEFNDEEFIVYQLMQSIPPKYWEKHFDNSPENILGYFKKEKSTQKYLPAFLLAIARFKSYDWALTFFQNSDVFDSSVIELLSEKEQDKFSIQHFEKDADTIIATAKRRETEWSHELAKKIFKHASKNLYQYNRSFYNECIRLIPGSILVDLEKFTPAEVHLQGSWSNIIEYIIKLVTLKQQAIQSFRSQY